MRNRLILKVFPKKQGLCNVLKVTDTILTSYKGMKFYFINIYNLPKE